MKVAHISKKDEVFLVQDLKEHLDNVAVLCRGYMEKIGCGTMGYIVGLLHDIGKAGSSFQRRMEAIKAGNADPGQKGGHASAGAVILTQIAGNVDKLSQNFAIQTMCEAIFSHHTALPDNISPEGEDGYTVRLQGTEDEEIREIAQYLWEEVVSKAELEKMLAQAYGEAERILEEIKLRASDGKEARYFMGLYEKMLLSALIDADWLDSALSGEKPELNFTDIIKEETDREENRRLFGVFLKKLESSLQEMNTVAGSLNVWRQYISDNCKKAGRRKNGVYTLACPTGAGKTLAGLRFALTHCLCNQQNRIFYIIPYMSIIEQNTKSIKSVLCQGKTDMQVENNILELHGNAEISQDKKKYGDAGECLNPEFFAQRMAEPIVLTTMVRFLNTFFADGTRNLRPAHQFQNAVIIFDEIQTLPIKQIAVFNSLINFLTGVCNCTCILCTATQPLLDKTQKPVYPIKMAETSKLTEIPKESDEVFKRVQVKAELKQGGYSLEDLSDFICNKAQDNENLLVIMNTKKSALDVYCEIRKSNLDEFDIYYLSTWLYPAHRKEIIEEIRNALAAGKKIIVISTQLIEAGVDLDFSCVIRSLAGMDSIIQAAGRCNREGKRKEGTTYIVNPDEKTESLSHLKDIREGASQTYRILQDFAEMPDDFEGDLLSDTVMERYFQYYFWQRKGEMTYRLPKASEYTLYDLLSDNKSFVNFGVKHNSYKEKALNQAFHTAAAHYNVIEEGGVPVFVQKGKGKKIWEGVQKNKDYAVLKKLLKEAQQFVINLPQYELEKLGTGKGVLDWDDKMGMYVLNEMYYDDKTGFTGEVSRNIPYYLF